jgi:hypothetical protein
MALDRRLKRMEQRVDVDAQAKLSDSGKPVFFWQWAPLLNARLARIEQQLNQLISGETQAMATLDDVRTAIASETNVVNAVTALLQQLSAQLKDAMASEDPAALQSLVDEINANANSLANAVAANTPGQGTSGVTPAPAPAPAT